VSLVLSQNPLPPQKSRRVKRTTSLRHSCGPHATSQSGWLHEDTLFAPSEYDPVLAPHSYLQDTLNAIYTAGNRPSRSCHAHTCILAPVNSSIPTCSSAPKVVDVFMCSLFSSSVATDGHPHMRITHSHCAASPANNQLVLRLTFRLPTQVLAQPSSKRSPRRVVDATVCTLQHMSSVAFRMRAHDKAQYLRAHAY
jgi:hypothetical protein